MRRALATLAAMALLGCGASRLPPEPPKRVFAAERAVQVILVSKPEGLVVHRVATDGSTEQPLGTTPVLLEIIWVSKELWKHGTAAPSPIEAAVVHEHWRSPRQQSEVSSGQLSWKVRVGDDQRDHLITLTPEQLRAGYHKGRIELHLVVD